MNFAKATTSIGGLCANGGLAMLLIFTTDAPQSGVRDAVMLVEARLGETRFVDIKLVEPGVVESGAP